MMRIIANGSRFTIRFPLEEAEEIRRFVARLPVKPKFSILVPVYQTPPKELSEMIASVKAQIYSDWELCIADDASTQPHIREILEARSANRATHQARLPEREWQHLRREQFGACASDRRFPRPARPR